MGQPRVGRGRDKGAIRNLSTIAGRYFTTDGHGHGVRFATKCTVIDS